MHILFYPKTEQESKAATHYLKNRGFTALQTIESATLSIIISEFSSFNHSFMWVSINTKDADVDKVCKNFTDLVNTVKLELSIHELAIVNGISLDETRVGVQSVLNVSLKPDFSALRNNRPTRIFFQLEQDNLEEWILVRMDIKACLIGLSHY